MSFKWNGRAARQHVMHAAVRVFHAAGRDAVAHAKGVVPVDTGRLQRSIDYVVGEGPVLVIYAATDYARYVEEGTAHMAAQPYLGPAVAHAMQTLGAGSATSHFS